MKKTYDRNICAHFNFLCLCKYEYECVYLCVWKHVKCADIFNQNKSHNKKMKTTNENDRCCIIRYCWCCWWQNVSANSCPFTHSLFPIDAFKCFCLIFFNQGSVIFFFSYLPSYLSRILHIYFIYTHSKRYSMVIEETNQKKNSIRQIQTELCCAWTCQTFRLFES